MFNFQIPGDKRSVKLSSIAENVTDLMTRQTLSRGASHDLISKFHFTIMTVHSRYNEMLGTKPITSL